MTVRKRFKRLVRARARVNGESYTSALRSFRRQAEESPMSDATDSNPMPDGDPVPGLTPRAVNAALRRAGSEATVTSCEAIEPPSFNHNYRIDFGGEDAVLRVWLQASPSQAEAELSLLRRLASCGLPTPEVLWPPAGERFVADGRPAAVTRRIDGRPGPNYMPRRVTDGYARAAGDVARLVATMHVSALGLEHLDYREPTWLTNLESWTRDLDFNAAGDRGREAVAAVERAARAFRAFSQEAMLPAGVVHGSPGPWNVLVDDADHVRALLDFDSAHRDHLVLDIAHIATQWGTLADRHKRREHYDPVLLRRIIDSYCAVRPLSAAELEGLAIAIPLRYGIEWLRIWDAVGEGRTPFDWEQYLEAFTELDLVESREWRELVAGQEATA